ncbi:hypothetical protein FAZ78_10480 [Cereibacter changlensis]|uniref:SatD family protein n=1 Tax=Cereibacter changlensis TaxID=402884 RepID=A0A4U0Z2A4_9RHOB|nr:hypothetical protein [Cereibacter changlensis]TKA96624.1 hypothetical protein FAZ78_10480 [Cereibacter changlensis]
MPRIISVITGDIVGSSDAPAGALERTMQLLTRAAGELTYWSLPPARFTRFRGDGWQVLVNPPELAPRVALFLTARLRADPEAMASRMSIGTGPFASLGGADLSDARGAAFELSGRGLDAMSRLRLFSVEGEGLTALHPVVLDLLEQHCRKWTRDQAAAAALALHPGNPTLQDMASVLGISPQAVNYRLSGGAVQAIRRALTGWEEAFLAHAETGSWTR